MLLELLTTALTASPAEVVLPVNLPNICRVLPLTNGKGHVIISVVNSGYNTPWAIHHYEDGTLRVLAKRSPVLPYQVTRVDENRVLVNGNNEAFTLDINKEKFTSLGSDARLDPTGMTRIVWEKDRPNLYLGQKKVTPPKGREFLLLPKDGPYVATERHNPNPETSEAFIFGGEIFEVEFWKINSSKTLSLVQSIGRYFWDGGSTGSPFFSELGRAGEAVFVVPGGGAAINWPTIYRPGEKPRRIGKDWVFCNSDLLPVILESGFMFDIVVLTNDSYAHFDHHYPATEGFSRHESYLAYTDGKSLWTSPTPIGFVGLWRQSPQEVAIAIKGKDGIRIRTLPTPPKNWFKLK